MLSACDQRRVVPVVIRPLLREYRYVLTDPEIVVRYPQLTPRAVDVAIARLTYVGDLIHPVTARFAYPRDPKDSMVIEVVIAGSATHLLTYDSDLLDLPYGRDDASKRFRQRLPSLAVLKPEAFLDRFSQELGLH